MAVTFGWDSAVDLDLKFSEFLSTDHTILVAFMPQYPEAYAGPLLAAGSGKATYIVGQGIRDSHGPKLLVEVGTQRKVLEAALVAEAWHHLAIVCETKNGHRIVTLFLQGKKLDPSVELSSEFKALLPALADSSVRLGNVRANEMVDGDFAQFYGMIDSVAVFTRALSAKEIATLASNGTNCSGKEKDLLAAWNFLPASQQSSLPAKLRRGFTTVGASKVVAVLSPRDDKDRRLLPLPGPNETAVLPIPKGVEWVFNPGFQGGTHVGKFAFCWDCRPAKGPQDGEFPNGAGGAPFQACAGGKVRNAIQSNGPGPGDANFIEVLTLTSPGLYWFYGHLRKSSSTVVKDDTIEAEAPLALVGDVGTKKLGANHLHFALGKLVPKDGSTTEFIDKGVTVPAAFKDYQVKKQNGTFRTVKIGIPKAGDVIRRPR